MDHLAAAGAALAGGDVEGAVASLRAAIEEADPPEAHQLLAGLCYLDDDFAGARRHFELAYNRFREQSRRRPAALSAAALAELHSSVFGNDAASRGWTARAERLIEEEGHCVERGYVLLAKIACDAHDLFDLERRADEAFALASEFGDGDLEVRALADGGYALVAQGRVHEGFARLDEAMAVLSAGGVANVAVAGKSFCALLSACDKAGSADRAEEWTRVIREGLLDRFGDRPVVLHSHCRLAYGSVLLSVGRWTDAEEALLDATNISASLWHRCEAIARLAELRIQQGRLEEAAELLRPHEDRLAACAPLALLHLTRGEHDLAVAAIRRGLGEVVGDRAREGALLALLVEVELQRDLDAASLAASRLAEVAGASESAVLQAESGLAAGRVAAARGEHDLAVDVLAEAQGHLGPEDRPMLCAAIRFERARALAAAGDVAAAIGEARAALAAFGRLGAGPFVDRTAALLRSLGAPGRPQGAREAVGALTARERDVLDLLRQGLTNAEIGERLYISAKTVEHHVGKVLAKLGVRSRAEAAAVAAALGSP